MIDPILYRYTPAPIHRFRTTHAPIKVSTSCFFSITKQKKNTKRFDRIIPLLQKEDHISSKASAEALLSHTGVGNRTLFYQYHSRRRVSKYYFRVLWNNNDGMVCIMQVSVDVNLTMLSDFLSQTVQAISDGA